jgi:hypothetical protein
MSRAKSAEEQRRDDIEERLVRLLNGQITSDEMGQIFHDARRYRALYRFVDETDVGAITASAVYPDLDDNEDPPAPAHLTGEHGDLTAAYGLALDALADFLDHNRNAGQIDDVFRRPLTDSERRSAKLGRDL